MDKHISKKEDGTANCPFCRGVIFRDFKIDEISGNVSFVMRCPHCQKNIDVEIGKKLVRIQEPENKTNGKT